MPEYLRVPYDAEAGWKYDEEARIAWQADRSEFYRRRYERARLRHLGSNHLDLHPQIYPRRWDWEFIASTETPYPVSNQTIRIYNDTWMPGFIGPLEVNETYEHV